MSLDLVVNLSTKNRGEIWFLLSIISRRYLDYNADLATIAQMYISFCHPDYK